MTSFRSNLNSVSSTHDGLPAIQCRLTTCFKQLRRKFIKTEQETYQGTLHEEHYAYYQKYSSQRRVHAKWFQQNYKDSRLIQKANENFRNFSTKLKEVLYRKFQFPRTKNRECQNCKNSEIVGKLLSSTLIAAKTVVPFDYFQNAPTIAPPTGTTLVEVEKKMTITSSSFLDIREEYPDLDREVRSILISRAQTGATIGEIKEDYRKNTGLRFPVYENITDFLLCIPGVMAYCNERGTRIFTVKPTEKTKHIYDLVMQQKAPSERSNFTGYSNGHFQHRRDSNFSSNDGVPYRRNSNQISNAAFPTWRTGNFYKQKDHNQNQTNHLSGSLTSSSFQNIQQQQQPFLQPPLSSDENNSRIESDGFVENPGGYYQDNCQHLFNRFNGFNYNNIHLNENPPEIISSNPNTEIQAQPIQPNQLDKDAHIFKRPIGRAIRGSIIRTSSPTGTRSSQRSISESLCSSDYDYDARILDFPLLGDDFFLYLARMELGCKFKKNQKVLQSGFCASGQTIKAAAKRFRALPFSAFGNRRIIVNIGSVDIMQGKPLVQIEHDFRNLVNIINKRGYQPILTTLAPLANYAHDASIKTKLERFNEFIKRDGESLIVIDLWALFMSERKQVLFDCYQSEPRQVTGAKESYVFWNKIGRQRVLQLITSHLEY